MVSERHLHRLVGAAVLVALAVIFVPVVFDLEPRPPLDTRSRIPPSPALAPAEIPEPAPPPVEEEPPPPEEAFSLDAYQPEPAQPLREEPLAASAPAAAGQGRVSPPEAAPIDGEASASAGALDAAGLPAAWVVQVASFARPEAADETARRLRDAGFRAFVRPGRVGERRVHRVFVGPFVVRAEADGARARLAAATGAEPLVVPFAP
ncbi:MAG: hypothetical protein KatS3mg124_0030 [Porticoccaceae bacterium]|nr:MAG: hypothetical protein KatS3mg124_0030 [Porticoccaceae bacterium]